MSGIFGTEEYAGTSALGSLFCRNPGRWPGWYISRLWRCSMPTTEALSGFFMIFAPSLLAHVEAGLEFLLELR